MDTKNLKILLERLNGHCSKAIEAAASFAATRGHYEVTIEHVVIKLLEEGGGDFDRLLYHFKIDLDQLWQNILDRLAKLPAGNPGKPTFSLGLLQWLERAWLATMEQDYDTAVYFAGVAVLVRPEAPEIRYNFARTNAFAGLIEEALLQLEKAIELGFTDLSRVESDAAFQPYIDKGRFLQVVEPLKE